jgi:hypothetical protein
MPKRPPPPRSGPQRMLPHDHHRDRGQPYATEVEDYSHGVAPPPAEQGGREAIPERQGGARKSDARLHVLFQPAASAP